MDLKIFKVGFDINEFNEFLHNHIVYKFNVLQDGTVYLFYKEPSKIGNDAMEVIETLDRLTKQAETEVMTHELEKSGAQATISSLKKEINKFGPNQKEYKDLDSKIAQKEIEIKMADESKDRRVEQIDGFKTRAQDIINSIK